MQHTVNTGSQGALSSSDAAGEKSRKPLVLVVDPDVSARSVLEVVLVRDGFDVWSTGLGSEGLSLIAKRVPDVIVLESDLGEEGGLSFVSEVRSHPKTNTVPVVLLARRDDENVAKLAEVVGIDDYVQKPAFARDISALVRLELAKAHGGREITFQTGQVSPAHVLRALLSCPRTGRLVLADGRGYVAFHQGQIIDARFGKSWGIEALVRSLVLTHGAWSLVLEPGEASGGFQCSVREFVQVVLPRIHEWEHVLLRSVPLEARLGVDFFRLSKSLATMPQEVSRIVQLFDGQRTVRQVLLDSQFDELLTLEVATRLYLLGVVLPIKDETNQPLVQKPAPRLFEPVDTDFSNSESWLEIIGGAPSVAAPEASDGGWQVASLAQSPQLAALAPEVARQIEAFNIRVEVEKREPGRSERREPVKSKSSRPSTPADEPTAPVSRRRFDPQERIITPELTPAVTDADVAETLFFASAASTAYVSEEVADDHSLEESGALPEARRLPITLFVGVAVVVLLIAFEVAMKRSGGSAEEMVPALTVVAPVTAPVPVLPDIEEPQFIEDEVPTTVVDVSGPLREAKMKYERGLYAEAISMLEQIIVDEPNSVQAWLLLGLARYDANNSKGAREAAEKVVSLEPNNAGVQMLLATLSFDSGDTAGAKQALEKYLSLEPAGGSAEEARALLAR